MVKWFKVTCDQEIVTEALTQKQLHVHPQSMNVAEHTRHHADSEKMRESTTIVPPLPSDISLKRVYRDLLRYLFNHAQDFYLQQPGATAVWERLKNDRYFIFTTPNGWDTIQQQFLFQAAVEADLIGGNDADLHLDFISEGEASVHFSLANGASAIWLQEGMLFAVIDAGGSTVDSTLYKCNKRSPRLVLSEQCASVCIQVCYFPAFYLLYVAWFEQHQTGGIFVDVAARNFFKQRFSGTKFCHSTCIDHAMKEFEVWVGILRPPWHLTEVIVQIKRGFGGPDQSTSMPVNFLCDDDHELGISNGRLSFTIEEIKGIFEGVTNSILDSCATMLSSCNVKVSK